jgi:phosphoribosylaminoimidazole (AIR) synthetase
MCPIEEVFLAPRSIYIPSINKLLKADPVYVIARIEGKAGKGIEQTTGELVLG